MSKWTSILSVLLLLSISTSSCKKEAELPPDNSQTDPQLPVTHTIAQLLAMNGNYAPSTGGPAKRIDSNITIYGIVHADDRSGNFYKSLVIGDSTASIMLLLDAYSLYATMPVGRKIYVNVKGLYLGYDGGLPVLGYSVNQQNGIDPIPNSEISKFITLANVNNPVSTDTFTVAEAKSLPAKYYNKLITIRDVQFVDSSSQTWTSPNATTNRDIEDCAGNKLVVRTSNYSSFAQQKLPNGKGSITGILTVYISTFGNKTPQLLVRDASDAQMNGLRCGQGPALPATLISIDSLKKMYSGSTKILNAVKITGIVISDRGNKNSNSQNLVVQNGNRGITVRFSSSHSFDLGDSVEINLDAAQLGEYNGLLEAGSVVGTYNFPLAKASLMASGKSVTPQSLTIAQLTGSNFENYESTLVRIQNATLSGGPNYVNGTNGNNSISDATDASGALKLYTLTAATFAGSAIPTTPKNITGIVGQFNTTKQLSIRNLSDVQ